jgi:hypothetical protein
MPNPNQRPPETLRAASRPARASNRVAPECVVLRRSRAPLGDLDQISQRSRETRLVLRPVPQLHLLFAEPVSIRCLRHRIGVQLLRSQNPTNRITPWQQHRTLGATLRPQQPTQNTSHTITHVTPNTGHGRHIVHTPAGTHIRTRRRGAPGTHHHRRPHLSASKPPRHRCLRPARHQRRTTTAAHPRNRSTPGGNPPRRWILTQRTRRPEQIINLNRRRHYPRRHNTHPRHDIEYARQPRQPAPNDPAERVQRLAHDKRTTGERVRPEGRSLRRPGRCPEPRHHFRDQGKITRLVVSSRRGQALPDGGPLRARDTPPLHSGPTARQPHRGAARRQPATPPVYEAKPRLRSRWRPAGIPALLPAVTTGNRIGETPNGPPTTLRGPGTARTALGTHRCSFTRSQPGLCLPL